jgi:CheY-like chemotaxis protein
MILEDEVLVALDIAKIVGDMTTADTVVVHSSAAARETVAHRDITLALLDVTLPDGMCFEVADWLLQHGTPYAFVTAYPRAKIPLPHRAAPVLEKPFRETQMRVLLSTLLVPPPHRPLGPAH